MNDAQKPRDYGQAFDKKVEKAVNLLATKSPADRGDAFKMMRDAGFAGSGKFFNAVIKGYAEKTGITLEKSEKSIAEADALLWAHNATTEEVKTHLASLTDGPDRKAWVASRMFNEGKWQDGAAALKKAFASIQPKVKVDAKALKQAVDTLTAENVTSRRQAFEVLATDNRQLFNAAVEKFEKTTGNTLERSENTTNAIKLRGEAHNMDAAAMREHMETCKTNGKPDEKFWIGWEFHKQGKWPGIERAEFAKIFGLGQNKSGPTAQRDQAADRRKEAEADMGF